MHAGRRKHGTSGAALAALRAQERRRTTHPVSDKDYAKLWMHNGGLTHAQEHLVTSPYVLFTIIALGLMALLIVPIHILVGYWDHHHQSLPSSTTPVPPLRFRS